jgi:hypothetical protein
MSDLTYRGERFTPQAVMAIHRCAQATGIDHVHFDRCEFDGESGVGITLWPDMYLSALPGRVTRVTVTNCVIHGGSPFSMTGDDVAFISDDEYGEGDCG